MFLIEKMSHLHAKCGCGWSCEGQANTLKTIIRLHSKVCKIENPLKLLENIAEVEKGKNDVNFSKQGNLYLKKVKGLNVNMFIDVE